MLEEKTTTKQFNPSSLKMIMEILSIEYGEDLNSLSHAPHQWVFVRDNESSMIGGICLTPVSSSPAHPLLANMCHHLKDREGWIASHLFCWFPDDIEEGSTAEHHTVSRFYQQLYKKLGEFATTADIKHLWMLLTPDQHFSLSTIGLFLFEKEISFNHYETRYIIGLPAITTHEKDSFWQRHSMYSMSNRLVN